MRLSNALSIGCNIGVFMVSDAFTFQVRSHYRRNNKLFVGNWENDDFLESLGDNGEDKSKSKEDDNANGSKFARLMKQQAEIQGKLEQQQQDAAYNPPTTGPVSFDQLAATLLNQSPPPGAPQTPPYPPPPLPPQYQQPPPQAEAQNQFQNQPQAQPDQNLQAEKTNVAPPSYPPPYPPQQEAQDPQSADPNAQPQPQQQQQQPYQYPPNPYPYPPPQYQQPPPQYQQQTSSDGRRVGRNRDADSIANTADLYFAQLKLDSKVRKQAFLSGDNDKANQVFGDERVKVLKETLQDNPHITAARRKAEEEQKALLESTEGVIDKMVENLEEYERKQVSKTYTGQSFKAKFAAKRGLKQKQATKPSESVTPPPAVAPAAQQPPSPQTIESVTPPPPPPQAQPVLTQAPPPPPKAVQPVLEKSPPTKPSTSVAQSPLQPSTPIESVIPEQQKNSIDISDDQYEDKSRQEIRTLQGLLMKHRGGPGFGAGILKPNEGKRLEESLQRVTDMLKAECDYQNTSNLSPSPSPTTDTSDLSLLDGSIECIQQALNMYNSASQDQKTALVSPLRSALVAAVNKFDEVIVGGEEQTVTDINPPKPVYDKVNDEKLLNTYQALKNASGNGKYGLKDLNSQEANDLIDALAQMKGILLAELEMGKTAKASPSTQQKKEKKSDTKSKFEEMFARAQAEERAGKTIGLD